ncbi:MAG: seg [Candidatus Paceibacter sp.]|jgi:DNA-binding transcriptional ArsR family regulator|nr:seg [Candidatus Paceibacter sp.]
MELQRDNEKDKVVSSMPYSPDLFHNDRDFYLAYRKIENIVAAIFLVTGLIEQDKLMKDSIREHSLNCLNRIVALIGKSNLAITDLQSVSSYVLHLSSLLDIAFWSGQISQMNLSMLQREISSTYQTLNTLSTKYKDTFYISSNFFKTDEAILNDTKEKDIKTSTPVQYQRQATSSTPEVSKGHNKGQDIRDTIKDKESKKTSEDKGHRREAILALLRERSNLTVKDFTDVVPQFSEKTIQRELLALVEEGVVRKEGERRWSTYSLAK